MYIPYAKQYIDEEDIRAVTDALRDEYLTTGPKVDEFERIFASYVGAKYAVAVCNGTAALHIACLAAGIGPGDEAITSPLSFAASANCVLYCGGTPVFADIDERTYNIDPEDIERKVTPRTKMIIPVHLTGQPCDLDAIHDVAKRHGLLVLEDAAHALGATYKGQKIGSLSEMTEFSFHPVKHITTGEGGMVTTDDAKLYERLKLFRTHGITRDRALMHNDEGGWYYEQLELGYNYRITDVQCALGICQMKKLERSLARRREIAGMYDKGFAGVEGIISPYQSPHGHNSYHLYAIRVTGAPRKQIYDALQAAGIGVNVHYVPTYKFPYYRNHGYDGVCRPRAEKVYGQLISLPMYYSLRDEEVQYVIEQVKKAMIKYM